MYEGHKWLLLLLSAVEFSLGVTTDKTSKKIYT
jgi:hypothetical protein